MAVYQTHFAEDIVKEKLQKVFQNKVNVWVPTKDTGVDILLTDKQNNKIASLQVKWSKNYNSDYQNKNSYGGWFAFKKKKIENSKADYWVLVVPSNFEKKFQFMVIKPSEMVEIYQKLDLYHDTINSYIDIVGDKVYESRGLPNNQRNLETLQNFEDREISMYLNNWERLMK